MADLSYSNGLGGSGINNKNECECLHLHAHFARYIWAWGVCQGALLALLRGSPR